MNCPNCGTANEPGRKFCGECGTRLAVACANCGTANAPGHALLRRVRHAARRGGRPRRRRAAGDGRHRDARPPVAGGAARPGRSPSAASSRVLFADLVGFTTLSEGRDPEEVRELLSALLRRSPREQIERYGGTVEKFIGDAVMAVWGAPTAHEDDAERAVRAALELVDAVQTLWPRASRRARACSPARPR